MTDKATASLVFLVVIVALGGPVLLQDEPALLTSFHDDAFYYFQVARNVAEGRGFTFDGIHPTNGFHPLWLFIVTPVYLFDPGEVTALRAIALLESALAAGAVALIFITLRGRIGAGAAATGALLVVALPGAREAFRYGMEGSLLLFLLALAWNRWLAAIEADTAPLQRWLVLGVVCALAFLARLEAGIIVPIIVLGFRRRLRPFGAALTGLLAPIAAAGAVYLLWNRLGFDLWLPISGMVKTFHASNRPPGTWLLGLWEIPWPGHELVCRLWSRPSLSSCPPSAQIVHGLLVAALIGAAWWRRHAVKELVVLSGIGLPLMLCAGMILADLRLVHFLAPWARVPIFLSTGLVCGVLLHRLPMVARRTGPALMVLVAVIMPLSALGADDPSTHYPVYRALAARWIDDHLPADHRVGSWNAGTLGYFAGRSVVNLDGLVNDAEYFERVIKGSDLEGYLVENRVGWIADQACGPRPRPDSYLERTGSGALGPGFELAVAFYNLQSPDGCPGYAIWKFNPGP